MSLGTKRVLYKRKTQESELKCVSFYKYLKVFIQNRTSKIIKEKEKTTQAIIILVHPTIRCQSSPLAFPRSFQYNHKRLQLPRHTSVKFLRLKVCKKNLRDLVPNAFLCVQISVFQNQ